jgi:hypothetical protein
MADALMTLRTITEGGPKMTTRLIVYAVYAIIMGGLIYFIGMPWTSPKTQKERRPSSRQAGHRTHS